MDIAKDKMKGSHSADMYKVTVAGVRDLIGVRDAWDGLVRQMRIPSVFCTWEWVYTWWEVFGKDYEPRVLFFHEGGALRGILPLALYKGENKAFEARTIYYCGSKELCPDHLDVICHPDDASRCLQSALNFFATEDTGWDSIRISTLNEGSCLLGDAGSSGFQVQTQEKSVAPYLKLSASFEEFTGTLNSKQRNNISRRRKKLFEVMNFRYEGFAPERCGEGIDRLFHLHGLRADDKNIESTFMGPELLEFHRGAARRLAERNWLWLRFISDGERTISAFYGFGIDGHLFGYQMGLDPQWRQFGPGMVLIYEIIREASSLGYKEYDLLRGGEEYKKDWTDLSRKLYSMSIYNSTLKGNISGLVSRSKTFIKGGIRGFLKTE